MTIRLPGRQAVRRALRPMLAFALSVLLASALLAEQPVTVLHFNDSHGHVEIPEAKEGEVALGGIARMAAAIAEVKAYNDDHDVSTLVLSAGDALQGTPLSTVFKGEVDFRCFNMFPLDAMCIGNHEFDYGLPNLRRLINQADFPVLSSNIRRASDGTRVFDGALVKEIGDEVAVIIGLTTPETSVTTMPSNVAGLTFEDPVAAAKTLVDRILLHRDYLIIALTHLGFEEDVKLATAVPGLDVIVGGHTHTVLEQEKIVGDTIVVTAGAYGEFLGQLDMVVDQGKITRHRWFLRPMDRYQEPRADVEAVVQDYVNRLGEELEQVVAVSKVPLDGQREHVRNQETNLGNLVADAMRAISGAEVALTNAGGIRASIDEGPITMGEVLTVLPFGNELCTVKLTGAQIKAILADSTSRDPDAGGFMQVSGVKVVVEGNEVTEITVNDEPLDPERTYLVATNDFMLEGGDGYDIFKEGQDPYQVGTKLSGAVVQYLTDQKEVAPEVEGRIVIK
jgi:5'-nucleotidase/UDP-sugar diphosphatase